MNFLFDAKTTHVRASLSHTTVPSGKLSFASQSSRSSCIRLVALLSNLHLPYLIYRTRTSSSFDFWPTLLYSYSPHSRRLCSFIFNHVRAILTRCGVSLQDSPIPPSGTSQSRNYCQDGPVTVPAFPNALFSHKHPFFRRLILTALCVITAPVSPVISCGAVRPRICAISCF